MCRFEKVKHKFLKNSKIQDLILDVGHNIQALESIYQRIRVEYGSETKISVIFGCKRAKDHSEINRFLAKNSEKIFFVAPEQNNR